MGRPLNKKYFGNRNIGTGGYTTTNYNAPAGDDKIGGEGVASYGTIVAGTGWTTDPEAYVSAPNIPSGVTATIQAHYKALSMSVTANGTGFNFGQVVEVNTGTASTKARATVAAITVVAVEVNAPGAGYAVNDPLNFTTGFDTQVQLRVTSISDPDVNGFGPVTGVEIVAGGVRSSTAPGTPFAHNNVLGGAGCTINFTWGVYSLSAPTVAGDYTVFPSTGTDGVFVSVPVAGTGLKADVTMGLLSVAVLTRGSGYTAPADAALLFDAGANSASATAVLTVDTGAVGSATNQENAIIVRAKTTSGGTVQIGDIIKQAAAHRYKVKTANGSTVCKLVATDSPLFKQAYIVATAANGSTYYVTKITAHKVVLTYKSGMQIFANGSSAPWSFTSTANGRVIIENA